MTDFKTDFSQICQKIFGSNYKSKHADIFPGNIFMIICWKYWMWKNEFNYEPYYEEGSIL